MLYWLYKNLDFWGTFGIMFLIFILFIFWIAGMAGIVELPASDRSKYIKIVICLLIPVYPIGWMITDMVQQYRSIRYGSDPTK